MVILMDGLPDICPFRESGKKRLYLNAGKNLTVRTLSETAGISGNSTLEHLGHNGRHKWGIGLLDIYCLFG